MLKRVHRQEVHNSAIDKGTLTLIKRARRLLVREPRLLDESARTRLQNALEHSQTLKTVYTMKQKLADVWQRSATTQEQLVQALQDWCREAEATGIQALKDFAAKLRHVRLVQTTA